MSLYFVSKKLLVIKKNTFCVLFLSKENPLPFTAQSLFRISTS